MAQPYIGEIRLFGGNFAPVGWLPTDGRLLPIDEYDVLFNLIGTTYGGDGQENFGLPDLRGRVPVHMGQGPGLRQTYVPGELGGAEEVTLNGQQLPQHGHAMMASRGPGTSPNPNGNVIGSPPAVTLFKREAPEKAMAASMVLPVGGNQPHENRMPFQAIFYMIAWTGIYPSPS
jgi:microcystin-dependent protein